MKIIFILLFLSSCGLIPPKPQLSENSSETPSWVYSPYDFCHQPSELCATGESKSLKGADAEAVKNLASIFESHLKVVSLSENSQQDFPWLGVVRQEVERSLQESVSQIFETVTIKKHFQSSGMIYSLASLDREKSSELIGQRLSKLDDELNALWSKRRRTNLRRIFRTFLERDKLNEKYSILSGHPRPSKLTYADIIEWRQTQPRFEPLALRIGQAPIWMSDKIKDLLTEAGFKIVKGDAEKAISLNVDSIKEFLTLSGFEKYTFTMNITSFEKGERTKILSASETVTGKSQADALLKVKNFFTEYIDRHLSDLDLD